MIKRVALIHTVRSVLDSFGPMLVAAAGRELKVHNILDDFLASDPAETGGFSETNRLRLKNDLLNAELTGADVIAVTCSTMTAAVASLRPSIGVPVVAIDDAMCRLAVTLGRRVMVLATARSTVRPTVEKLRAEASARGTEIEVDWRISEPAYGAIVRGDRARHDELVEELAESAPPCDVIVLAQASMAHLEGRISATRGLPVLSSPSPCIAEILELLDAPPGDVQRRPL